MEISNQKRSKKIKRAFNFSGIAIVLIGLIFLWLKLDAAVLITAGVFAAYVGISMFANLCYVYFSTNNGKVVIRYFQVISIMKKEYESIEFAHQALVNFKIERTMGFSDLQIAIKTKRGIAEYPSVSLTALSKDEIEKIHSALSEIRNNNRKGI
ncbi:MAG: hypothetical protein Q8S54_19655 [Bacteroidota bacterium]|nr:hypothetical protein [Odoribacter sp.]MDP3645386.1 hypothetical protein [Bacteroidota bacterium]